MSSDSTSVALSLLSGQRTTAIASSMTSDSTSMTKIVNYRGGPVDKSTTGRWTAALFIIGVETAERAAYYGVSMNLISYLTGPLQKSNAAAAVGVNTWSGVALMMPLLGAFVADSYLGRYRTIIIASAIYVVGLGLLMLSSVPRMFGTHSQSAFYLSLYLVALAQGGHKPCVQAFGADQFDDTDPSESASRSSFFNWWYFGITMGTIASVLTLSYVQDNISWGLGFGIPCVVMAVAFAAFLMGTRTYRYCLVEDESPFARIGRTYLALIRNWLSRDNLDAPPQPSAKQAEEAKGVLRLFPIWATCLIYAVVFAQSSTFFTKQGGTMDRRIGSRFLVPPAALQSFIGIATVVFVPVYDRALIPLARRFTKLPSGITLLQRIGVGMFVSTVAMVVAAVVETKRLDAAREHGLVDQPKATVPMRLWWLVPQYALFGIADVFTMVGLQEFFYDQVPDSLRSLGLALYVSIFGIGSFVSSFIVSVIHSATGKSGRSWLSNNLNSDHLDYFYWLLAGLSALELLIYLFFARAYVYKKQGNDVED